jgi:hypothetical protein
MRQAFRSGASIHAHTHYSRENLGFLHEYTEKLPWVRDRVRHTANVYKQRTGRDLDLGLAYWTPPFSPEQVLRSETKQIHDAFDLEAIVSLTDHDSFQAPLSLGDGAALSTEWTVPFENTYVHLGVHNVDASVAHELIPELHRFTMDAGGFGGAVCASIVDMASRAASDLSAADLLERLNRSPETLIVFNHPLWDVERSGTNAHNAMLARFLAKYGRYLHALEINGFRPWKENVDVLTLADAWGLPVVAGGDRHGASPNMVLNLTAAETLGEFAREVREERISDIVLMPAYREPQFTKEFRTAGDALAFYPEHPEERRAWTGRVYFEEIPGAPKAVFDLMDKGMPGWLAAVTAIAGSLGSGPIYRCLNATLPREPIALPPVQERLPKRVAAGSLHEMELQPLESCQ